MSAIKRSFINRKIREGIEFLNKMSFIAPPFVYWKKYDWENKGSEYDEIRKCMLGWDITDFGMGDFERIGLLVITLRNGLANNPEYFKKYAEKCLIVQDRQITPMHFHFYKMEDIINRGGGNIIVKVYNSDDRQLADTDVQIFSDGRRYSVKAGSRICLTPGESITLPSGQYHSFWAEGGTVLVSEISKVNDDNVDNHFLDVPARFPGIEEDEPIIYPLFNET